MEIALCDMRASFNMQETSQTGDDSIFVYVGPCKSIIINKPLLLLFRASFALSVSMAQLRQRVAHSNFHQGAVTDDTRSTVQRMYHRDLQKR